MARYPNASTEPLDVIRSNECEALNGLATERFQALWNEIVRLGGVLDLLIDASDKSANVTRDPFLRGAVRDAKLAHRTNV